MLALEIQNPDAPGGIKVFMIIVSQGAAGRSQLSPLVGGQCRSPQV
ncbi:hypothetical protein [Microcoleus sp. herbarium12]